MSYIQMTRSDGAYYSEDYRCTKKIIIIMVQIQVIRLGCNLNVILLINWVYFFFFKTVHVECDK